ncbi:MAG: DUF4783 domain-containing protein [Candidatus Krumholzibacteria bacterium]|nr:DUF4783 domain-containing protein [Candidatus Krumholzibacteria bacterium]
MRTACLTLFCLLLASGWVGVAASDAVVLARSKMAKSTPKAKPTRKAKSREPADSTTPVNREADNLGPIGVFADIEEGWKKENVRLILRHYGKGKVAIAIDGIGPRGGAFSKNQSHYLLKDLFKYTITKKFEFIQYRNVSDGRAKVYAVAERSYKRNDDGRLFEDKIYVSLQLEDSNWVISEIKSIR